MIWYLYRTIKETFSNKKFIIGSVCILTLIVIGTKYISAVSSSNEGKKNTVVASFGVTDLDQSIYSKMLLQYFEGAESFQKFATITVGTEEEMHKEFLAGKLNAYLVIPDQFAQCLMDGSKTKIRVVINSENTVVSVMLSNMLDSYDAYITNVQKNSFALYDLFGQEGITGEALKKANFDTSLNLVNRALLRDDLFVKEEVSSMPHTPLYKYYIWVLVSLIVVYSGVLSGLSYLRELSSGTYARLRIMGHSAGKMLAGILVSHVAVWSCIIYGAVWILCICLQISLSYWSYAFLFLAVAASHSCFCLIARICSNSRVFMAVSNFGLFLLGIIGGVVIPISVMPYRFLALAKLSPNYWIINQMIRFTGYKGKAPAGLFMGIAASALFCYLMTLILERCRGNWFFWRKR